ncbi:hypothetical protein E2C01_045716 [Portunus trituberculatus]|uniref:Uncharacterized protein n=1 Tax=Portunus trituberculatus TaxID=210409 RepID=A0A5B7FWI3_PORTR|nr:hypothetical protein [Portunus trituberculatus]
MGLVCVLEERTDRRTDGKEGEFVEVENECTQKEEPFIPPSLSVRLVARTQHMEAVVLEVARQRRPLCIGLTVPRHVALHTSDARQHASREMRNTPLRMRRFANRTGTTQAGYRPLSDAQKLRRVQPMASSRSGTKSMTDCAAVTVCYLRDTEVTG